MTQASHPSGARASPDEALARGLAAHDEVAFGELYARYRPLVASIARQIVRDESTVDEIVQDVFHALWSRADRLQPGTSLALWLSTSARWRAVDAWRSKLYRERQREEWIDDPAIAPRLGAGSDFAEDLVQRDCIRSALAHLRPCYRVALTLAYREQLSPAEIAEKLGLPLHTVRRQLRHGLEKLRTLFVLLCGNDSTQAGTDAPAAPPPATRRRWDTGFGPNDLALELGA
jgi:RNA polymerase sigma-70 factor (ECF subfamily)